MRGHLIAHRTPSAPGLFNINRVCQTLLLQSGPHYTTAL